MTVLNLTYSGQEPEQQEGECIIAEYSEVGFSESTCGNGNSDLYKALMAMISGNPLPTRSSPSSFSATVWAQDQIGNGYEINIARGTLKKEEQVTTQPVELFFVSPSKIKDGYFNVEDNQKTKWIIDRIWSVSWEGSVTDANGVPTARPALTIEEKKIKLTPSDPVIGVLKIKFELTRDKITVSSDGDGETKGDPFSTSLSFDVDGCEDEQVLPLTAQQCLAEGLGNPLGVDELLESLEGGDLVVEEPPLEDNPQDTERRYQYCTREFISASPREAGEGYEDTCLGIQCGKCGNENEN